ncbi:PAS domain S-box-containing protein [Dyella sp. OK004]|uniref:PAS domain S-box protein n=1 Tax=Dyella sp. OK004 TaxID=1855292 RepID=UPI0008F0016D|nr:PAS domain S-box protein [Dyella sp. OK004]SFS14167.1 PAS domain S-box-containing protein [Dyella sp. OK004]
MFWSLLVLLASCGYAAFHGWVIHENNKKVVAQQLDSLADRVSNELQERFRTYEYGLRGARGAVIAAGGTGITHAAFARYMRSRDMATEFPGSRGFGYIVPVKVTDLAAFVAQAQSDRGSPFQVRELSPNDGEHFVIKYVEPESLNLAAIGLDIASESNRREAAVKAMSSGKATLTAPITLVQATGAVNHSMLFLLPIYSGEQLPPENQRAGSLLGWTYTPLVTDEILGAMAGAHADISFSLADIDAQGKEQEVYATRAKRAKADAIEDRTRQFSVYGRQWRLIVAPDNTFLAGLDIPDPVLPVIWIATGGSLLALAVFLATSTAGRRRRALAQRARLATIVEDSHDAIIGTSLDGTVTEWNRAATHYFGYEAGEAIGKTIADLIVPARYIKEDHDILERVFAGENVAISESVRRQKNGSTLFVDISASPIRDGHGRIVGAAKTLRNITERKLAERKILELNATLEEQVQRRTAELQSVSALHQAILSNAGYAIIATDPKGTVTLFNPAAEAMLGYKASEVVGIHSPALFHDKREMVLRSAHLTEELQRNIEPDFEVFVAKAQDAPDVNEWTYIRKDAQRISVLLNVSALRREDDTIQGYLGIAASLVELKRREAALEINERKLRGLFELSPLGIALTDEVGRLIEFNEAYRALTGYSEAELLAMDYWSLTPSEYLAQEQSALMTLELNGRYGPYDKHYIRKNGSRVPVRLNGVSLRIDSKPCTWSIVEDTTDQRLAEATMVKAIAAAEAASKAKSDFLANMSHEIRTPMNAVLGMLQLLQRTSLDDKQRDYTSKTETAATTLLALLNDVLDFSKIEAGRQTLEIHEFDLDQMLREISVIVSANVGNKDVEVVFDIDPRIPDWLMGDSLRLRQVLINLAGNAVKFTQAGDVRLQAKLLSLETGHALLRFEVTDTGIGIAGDKLSTIFDGFSQAEASTTRRYGGSGLGLAISRQLVTLMGGELHVESEPGMGSCFYFTVELETTASPPIRDAAEVMRRLCGIRVLVVDDNSSARDVIADMVRSLGWTCDTVEDGPQALRQIDSVEMQNAFYDVILMDWSMPGMDGWEVSRRIRERYSPQRCPLIVMVTMHEREAVANRHSQSDSVLDGFLIKPITASMLLDAVADALACQHPALQARTRRAIDANDAVRLDGIRILVVEDNLTNQQVAKDLLELEGASVDVASSGRQAIQLLDEAKQPYHLVLMDIQMPDMDGFTATRHIRDMPELASLPIVAMTANVLESDRLACLAAGMNDHVGKPFDLNVLVDTIHRWIGRSASISGVPSSDARPGEPAKAFADVELDYDGALARFNGRRAPYHAALRSLDRSAREALALLGEAVADDSREDAARALHTLKGVAATVGALRLATFAAVAERRFDDPLKWREELPLGELKQLIEYAVLTANARLAEQREVPAVHAGDGVSRPSIEELATLLRASSMRSVELYETIRPVLSISRPEMSARLNDALMMLDFPKALAVCELLLHTYGEGQR